MRKLFFWIAAATILFHIISPLSFAVVLLAVVFLIKKVSIEVRAD